MLVIIIIIIRRHFNIVQWDIIASIFFKNLFKRHLLLKQQREDGGDTLGVSVLPHDPHTEVDVILGPEVNPGTGHLEADMSL